MLDCECQLEVFRRFITSLTSNGYSGILSVCQSFKSLFKRVFFDKLGPGFLIPGWKRAFINHIEPALESYIGPSGGQNHLIQPPNSIFFWFRQTWQSHHLWQRKIMTLFDRNHPSKPNFQPQFIIRMTSNHNHYLWKVTPNLSMYRMYLADLYTKIFNGI